MSPLAKKLQIRPNSRCLILNAPDFFIPMLSPLPEECTVSSKTKGEYEYVHFFAYSIADLGCLAPKAIKALKDDGLFWISYPKKTGSIKTDLSRDCGWPGVTDSGFEGVRQISIDDTWSAIRFRLSEYVRRQ